jgi:hypothetical protein
MDRGVCKLITNNKENSFVFGKEVSKYFNFKIKKKGPESYRFSDVFCDLYTVLL